jgi:hypothetical protein
LRIWHCLSFHEFLEAPKFTLVIPCRRVPSSMQRLSSLA